jgi:hypothetical protein
MGATNRALGTGFFCIWNNLAVVGAEPLMKMQSFYVKSE